MVNLENGKYFEEKEKQLWNDKKKIKKKKKKKNESKKENNYKNKYMKKVIGTL